MTMTTTRPQEVRYEPEEDSYEDIVDRYSKFQTYMKDTNVKGIKHLTIEIELPFRDRLDVSEWLREFVYRLEREPRLENDPNANGGK